MKKILIRVLAIAVVVAAALGGYRLVQRLPQKTQEIPTTKVRRGEVTIRAYTRGELRAVRSVTLTAPNLFGTVQVTKLAPLGALAREKHLIVEFDDSEVLSRLEEKQLELEQVDEQIRKAQAELAIRNNQDQVELLRARYAVRRSELEVKLNELLSQIDARKNLLNLEEARRRMKQLESDVKSRQEQAEAEIAVLREQKNKATIELNREKERLSQTRLLAPMSGLVFIHQNRFMGGRMFGMQVPDIREGDQIQVGMPVADVLDLSELEVLAKIGELDRANLKEGQDVAIQFDALPESRLQGKIKSMSGTASANIFSGDPAKKFDVTFSVDMKALLGAVGATPEQIERILEMAQRNRSRPATPMASAPFPVMMAGSMAGGPPSEMGGGGAMRGGQGGGEAAGMGGMPGGPEAAGGERRGMWMQRMSQMPEEQRRKMQEAFRQALGGRNMQELSEEERRQLFSKMRETFRPEGGRPPGQGGPQAGGASGGTGAAPMPGAGASGTAGPPMAGMAGMGASRWGGGGAGGGTMGPFGGLRSQFSEKELAEAQLPPPPGEGNQMEVLLRPGLLAEVEITVEKIPDAIYVPSQAVFEKEGKFVVFLKSGNRFEERTVKLAKRSESTVVVSEGVKPGDLIALSDPTAKKGEKKQEKPEGGAAPVGGMSAGGRS